MKAALLLLAAATVGAAGCTNNDISLSILQMEAVTPATMCVAMSTVGSSLGRDRGLLDVAKVNSSGYIAVPVIKNNLSSLVNGGVEYNSIQLTGVNVKLATASGGTLTLPSGQSSFFYAAAGGRLDPSATVAMFVEVLPAAAAKSLAGMIPTGGLFTVIADVRPVGMRSSDQVVGGPISLPIDLCNGCLTNNVGTCPLPKGTPQPVSPCFPQQDDVNTCCTDATGAQLCGAAAPVATM